jgi:ribonuclease HI
MVQKVEIFTDGSVYPNPKGVGGWAYYAYAGDKVFKNKGGANFTTNNRMELQAVIESLQDTQILFGNDCTTIIYSDSKYVVNGFNNWMHYWQRKGITERANMDQWKELMHLGSIIRSKAVWIRGHSKNYYNDLVDDMANQARHEFTEAEIERMWQQEHNIKI